MCNHTVALQKNRSGTLVVTDKDLGGGVYRNPLKRLRLSLKVVITLRLAADFGQFARALGQIAPDCGIPLQKADGIVPSVRPIRHFYLLI